MNTNEYVANFCKNTEACTIAYAMQLAAENNYDPIIVAAIIARNDCSFMMVMGFIKEIGSALTIMEAIAKRDDFKELSYLQLKSMFFEQVYSNGGLTFHYEYNEEAIAIAIASKIFDKYSLAEIVDFAKKTNYHELMIELIKEREEWQKLDASQIEKGIENLAKNESLAKLIISHPNCSFSGAMKLLKRFKSLGDDQASVASEIIERNDFDIIEIVTELNLVNQQLTRQNSYLINKRKDYPLPKAYAFTMECYHPKDQDDFLNAVLGIIERNDCPFEKALKFAEMADFKSTIIAFEKRQDFSIENRIMLIKSMQGHIINIMKKENSGDYPHYSKDLPKIAQKIDWVKLALHEAFNLAAKIPGLGIIGLIIKRDDWKSLSLTEAIELVQKTNFNTTVIGLIIEKKICPWRQAMALLKQAHPKYKFYDYELVDRMIARKDCTFKRAMNLLARSNSDTCTAVTIAEKKAYALTDIIAMMINGHEHIWNIQCIVNKHDDWKKMPPIEAINLLQKIQYKDTAIKAVVSTESWRLLSFAKASQLLEMIDWTDEVAAVAVVESMIFKPDCTVNNAKDLICLLDLSKESVKKIVQRLTMREQFPLTEALGLAKITCHGSYKGIVVRSDWKKLSLAEIMRFINKYRDPTLLESIAMRTDWKKLKTADKLKLTNDVSLRSLYRNLIIASDDCTYAEALAIVEESKYNDHDLVEMMIQRDDCPLEMAFELANKTECFGLFILAIISKPEWKALSLDEVWNLAKKEYANDGGGGINTEASFMIAILKRDDYQNLSPKELFDSVRANRYHQVLIA